MASSSNKSAAGANLLGKRKPEDDLETKPILKKHKETSEEKEKTEGLADTIQPKSDQPNFISVKEDVLVTEKSLFMVNISNTVGISDIIDFFKDVVQVVHLRLNLNRKGQRSTNGFVEFASANDAKKAFLKKNGEYLHGRKIFLYVDFYLLPPLRSPRLCIDHKVWYKEYPRREDKTPADFVGEVLFVAHISPQTRIFHIKDFFKDVGEVVSVRLIVNDEGRHVGYGFVEFASANEAKKALEKKNGEYLLDHQIFLEVAKTAPPPPKYNLAEKLCYEDYLRRLVKGLDETPDFVEAVAIGEKSVYVNSLSLKTQISDIISFFEDVGDVVHVRLVVDHTGEHVGYGFVEFASANEAKKALDKKKGRYLHGHKISLDVAKNAPHPPRPKYCIDHKVWYEDYLGRERLLIKEDETVEGLDDIPDYVEEVATREKTLFASNLPRTIKEILVFFKPIGGVASIRIVVDHRGESVGCCFVEFASSDEAEKALRKKNYCEIFLNVAEMAPYPLRPKYNLVEKLWTRWKEENLWTEEDSVETEPNYLEEEKVFMMGGYCGKKTIFSYGE